MEALDEINNLDYYTILRLIKPYLALDEQEIILAGKNLLFTHLDGAAVYFLLDEVCEALCTRQAACLKACAH